MSLQKEKIQLDQLVNSEFEKENISKTRLTVQIRSLISDVVSQSNGITTLEKGIALREGEGEVPSINPVIGQEKEEKRTMVKALVIENATLIR